MWMVRSEGLVRAYWEADGSYTWVDKAATEGAKRLP